MIERIIILENIDPIVFYGINNCNIQLIKTLFPKLRFTARGMVIKVIGDENETAIFESKIKQLEKYCAEYNILNEEIIIDIIKGQTPTEVKQEHLIIHGVNGKPIIGRTENQTKTGKNLRNERSCICFRPCRIWKNVRSYSFGGSGIKK